MPERRPLLVVLSGPSGVGKDAILDELERRGRRFHRVVTCTTRPPRPGERHGIDYFFVSADEFDEMLEGDGLLEHAVVYGQQYGVPQQQVLDAMERGDDVFVRTDVQGATSIKKLMPEAVLVFIAPPSLDDLQRRIRGRGKDDEARMQRRLDTARSEMARQGEFEHVIVNEDGRLDAATDRVEEILGQTYHA